MDKLMDNRWFMKIIALLLALLLYSAVPNSNKSNDISVPGEQNTETLQDVPVHSIYDTENLVIAGVPNNVEVTIQGPMPSVQSAKALKNFEVYVDLTEIKLGSHTVPIKIRNLSSKLKVQIEPAYANISVQEKVTMEFKVEAEYNNGLLEEGYEATQPVVEPSTVLITGAKDTIDRITYVKATIDLKEKITNSITREAKIRVLDRELNKLDVVVEPETVQVTIPVKSAKKTVPIKIVEKGTAPTGIIIESMELDEKEAVIIGQEEILKKTEQARVEVDVTKITNDMTLTLPVIISDGITKVSPQMVKVKIMVTKVEEKTFLNLPIASLGLDDSYELKYVDPSNASVDLVVYGPSEVINELTTNDFNLFIDVANLRSGNYEIEINVDGPDQVDVKLKKTIAKIVIAKKEV